MSKDSIVARIRAVVQYANADFADKLRKEGHKYQIVSFKSPDISSLDPVPVVESTEVVARPLVLKKKKALQRIRQMLLRSRGCELVGNFNPNLIAELFWEQSDPWEKFAKAHMIHPANIHNL